MTTGPDDSQRSLGPTGGPAECASSTRAPGRTAAGQRGLLSGLGDRCGERPPFRTVRFYGRCVRHLPGRRVLVTGLLLILVALLGHVLALRGAARAAAAATTRPHAATTALPSFPAAVTAPASQTAPGRDARLAGPAAVFAPEAATPALTAAPPRLALTAGGGGARFTVDSGGTVTDLSGGSDLSVYRTWGGGSRQWGHSWTPENPLTMANARDWLGLPKANAGIYLTRAQVLDTAGVTTRAALPIPADGVLGGGPEWLFPDPASQLQEIWTIPVIPPF